MGKLGKSTLLSTLVWAALEEAESEVPATGALGTEGAPPAVTGLAEAAPWERGLLKEFAPCLSQRRIDRRDNRGN